MPLHRPSDESISATLEIPCKAVGFSPPPVATSVRFLRGRGRPALLFKMEGPMIGPFSTWLTTYGPVETRHAGGKEARTVLAIFNRLPRPWLKLIETFAIRSLILRSDGLAVLKVEAGRGSIREFLARSGVDPKSAVTSAVSRQHEPRPLLSEKQRKALAAAVADGYYDIPRRIDLRSLARKLGTSIAALSEILRRAEARLIARYFDGFAVARRPVREPGVRKRPGRKTGPR
jgi:hypothetical protein